MRCCGPNTRGKAAVKLLMNEECCVVVPILEERLLLNY